MKKSSNQPVVAIVGRPNVGKSSLFNLLIGERKSIVDEMEGVTRDINVGHVTTPSGNFVLYDTAGYLEKGDSFNQLVQEKVRAAIGNADLLVFMVDGRDYHPLDEELGLFLKKQERPVIVVANKLDNNQMENMAFEFFALGFEEVMPLSVVQKRGISSLLEKIEDTLAENFSPDQEQMEEVRMAIVGKPNVGKSMLLNTILGYDRSIVSEVPGTTRDSLDEIITWTGYRIRLVDTAGLRRKSKIEEDIEYYSNVRTVQAVERADVAILLFDASETLSNQDKHIARMVLDKGRALVIAVNKWDLVRPDGPGDNYKQMREVEKFMEQELPEYRYVKLEFISAKDKYKIDKLMKTALEVNTQYHHRVSTAQLNQWLESEIKENSESKPRSQLKVYYVTQVFSAPPRFVFFINSKKHVRKDYGRFLENRLREKFGFAGVPLNITFREKEREPRKRK